MYQALYRKYRPQSFEDVVSQEYIKKILINSILNNKVSHAYLFSGPRGIGKTSIAKIFAKAVNCLNFKEKNDACLECENCKEFNSLNIDVLEIDAASNNGVAEIRDLKSKVSILPTKLKYRVYIIDEVHMLSNSAFNALLKTLEEPPSHVLFILATTEFYQVPETIVSRCQCFNFDRISNENIVERLKYIANKENISIEDEALKDIAIISNGGMRDSIGMLDKLASFKTDLITHEDFTKINGLVSDVDIVNSYNYIVEENFESILEIINKIDKYGFNYSNYIERLMVYIKNIVVEECVKNNNANFKKNILIINKLNDLLNILKTALNPMIMVQVSLLEIINEIQKKGIDNNLKSDIYAENLKISKISQEIVDKNLKVDKNSVKKEEVVPKNDKKLEVSEKIKNIRVNNTLAKANLSFKKEMISCWSNLDKYKLDKKYGAVVQLLEGSIPMVVSDSNLIITNERESVVSRMYSNHNVIENLIELISNKKYKCVYLTSKEFEIVGNKYKIAKENGKMDEYMYQEETEELVQNEKNNEENVLLSKALNMFGDDLVEYEEE